MKYDPKRRRSESIRLKGYDYSQPGAYFVTICSYNRIPIFGHVVDGEMHLNEYGKVVDEFWDNVALHFPNVEIDVSVVMPNHVHAVIVIKDTGEGTSPLQKNRPTLGQKDAGEGTSPLQKNRSTLGQKDKGEGTSPLQGNRPVLGQRDKGEGTSPLQKNKPTLGQIVAYYKYQTIKLIKQMGVRHDKPVWQKDYYDHIIRNEDDLNEVRQYVLYNSSKWEMDKNNPVNIKKVK